MLVDSMLVTTVAVTDLDQAKAFYRDQLGLQLLDEQPFAIRFGAGKGTQVSVRRGQPNVGQTVGHFEVDDIEAVVRELTIAASSSRSTRRRRRSTSSPRSDRPVAPGSPTPTATSSGCARDPFPGRLVADCVRDQPHSLKRSSFQGSASLL